MAASLTKNLLANTPRKQETAGEPAMGREHRGSIVRHLSAVHRYGRDALLGGLALAPAARPEKHRAQKESPETQDKYSSVLTCDPSVRKACKGKRDPCLVSPASGTLPCRSPDEGESPVRVHATEHIQQHMIQRPRPDALLVRGLQWRATGNDRRRDLSGSLVEVPPGSWLCPGHDHR